MFPGRSGQLQKEHAAILAMLDRLEPLLGSGPRHGPARAEGMRGLMELVVTRVEPHLEAEVREVVPLLVRHLSAQAGAGQALLAEIETLRAVIALLRSRWDGLGATPRSAEGEVGALCADLAALLREHARKLDTVVQPLLERLEREGRLA